MAKQVSVAKRERTVNILTFYKLKDKYYVRKRSSLSGKRVKNSDEFKNTMTYAHRMGIASRLASVIYRQLPPAWKLHELYRKLTGHAMNLLKEGVEPNAILNKLNGLLQELGYQKEIKYQTIRPSTTKLIIPKKIKSQPLQQSQSSVNGVKRKRANPICLSPDRLREAKEIHNKTIPVSKSLAPLCLSG